ncbi:Saccharopine dehydrogenase-like oxidoreductase [Nymphon striatum]|nr:Saccharopine dehydrogenase-like oxidoreductase [Nymphon striatum]
MAEDKVDFMIFGASGYTGQYVVEILAKTAKDENVTWAVSGRYMDKIKKILDFVAKETKINLDHIKILKADTKDYESLLAMCKISKIVLNCVGPYRWFGEPVVKACLETGAHHVDISGEPNFMEQMQLLYHDVAKKKGNYIISACGFDSIPCEMGTVLLNKEFGQSSEINSVEQHISLSSTGSGGGGVNHGTWDSAVNSFSLRDDLAETRRRLKEKFYTKPCPKSEFKLESRGVLSKTDDGRQWSLTFPSADASVFYRTQKDLFQEHDKRPAQFKSYIELPSIVHALCVCFVGIIMNILAPFAFTRNLLHKYPEIFSLGIFSKAGPTREHPEFTEDEENNRQINRRSCIVVTCGCCENKDTEEMCVLNSGFRMKLVGEGWKEKLASPTDRHQSKPDKKITVIVDGPNAGYIATPIAMIQSGLMILKQADKLPSTGGVYTPGVAFRDTTLIDRLNKNGFTIKAEE